MKPKLIRISKELFYFKNGKEIMGKNPEMSGDCSGLRGKCSGVDGDLDDCVITNDERKKGVNIQDLVKEEARGAD